MVERGERRAVPVDPDRDDSELFRTIVLLLRTVALAVTARTGAAELATAEEKIAEALTQLGRIDKVKRLAVGIQKSATNIDVECTGIGTAIRRLLDEALLAMGAADVAGSGPALGEVEPGAA